jgi:linoleoyl-CoA desaturase
VEHHLFPDLPSNRYQEIAPQVQALFAKYDLPYVTGSLPRQVGSAWKKVFRLSLPNDFRSKAQAKVLEIARPVVRARDEDSAAA